MAEIKQDLQQVGQQVFLNIKIGTSEVIDILLKNTSGHRLRIKGFSINSTSSTVKMDKNVVEKNDTLKAQVTLTADKIGYVSEFLNIETDSKEDPTIPVQIQYIGVKDN
jgi:hypothetical protein